MVVKPAALVVAGLVASGFLGYWIGRGQASVEPQPSLPVSKPISAPERNYDPGDHYVDHVVDGDSVWLRKDDRLVEVRLLRVDTPEQDEAGYKEATEELQRLLGDESNLRLEYEDERRDEHGRTLAYIFVEGRNVNVDLVRSGWSPYFTRYGRGKYASEFEAAQAEARRDRRGIWANR